MPRLCFPLILLLATLGWAGPAAAYLDPGTGSMLVQGLIAAFAVVSGGIAAYWTRIKLFFSGRKGKVAEGEQSPPEA